LTTLAGGKDMPDTEKESQEAEASEERGEKEEEKRAFPVWIIPLIIGPIILIVLILALAGTGPEGNADVETPEVFNQPKLEKEAGDFLMKAELYYNEAHKVDDQKKRDALLDKAAEACDAAIDRLNKIDQYYEEHNIQHEDGSTWSYEKTLSDACKLRSYIGKDRGFSD